MPPLDGTLALAQDLDAAVFVGQDLKLDVAGRADEFLQVHVRRAEGGASLVLRLREQKRQILGTLDHPHPAPAAAGGSLQDHGITDLPG